MNYRPISEHRAPNSHRALIYATIALAASLTGAKGTGCTVDAAPRGLTDQQLTMTADVDTLTKANTELDNAMDGRKVDLKYVMDTADRSYEPLCHTETSSGIYGVYTALTRTSGVSAVNGFCWNEGDDEVRHWMPQGITTTQDATDSGAYEGHRMVAVSWYHKLRDEHGNLLDPSGLSEDKMDIEKGVRISFSDWDEDHPKTYRHVLLVVPTEAGSFEPLEGVHAGGLIWYGDHLYVADTNNGIRIFDVRRIYRSDSDSKIHIGRQSDGTYQAFGYAFIMPQIGILKPDKITAKDDKCDNKTLVRSGSLTHSFISLDRSTTPISFIVGEYVEADAACPGRIARLDVETDDRNRIVKAHSSEVWDTHMRQLQGAASQNGRFWFGASRGPEQPGVLASWRVGAETVTLRDWAVGSEDLAHSVGSDGVDRLWTVTEYAGKRIVVSVPASDWN